MKYYVIKQDTIEYHLDIYVDDRTGFDVYRLSYSENGTWHEHVHGDEIVRVINTGNGFKIKWEDSPKKGELDYSQMRELQIVLSAIQKIDPVDDDVLLVKHDELMRI